jgi:hypothetical protein
VKAGHAKNTIKDVHLTACAALRYPVGYEWLIIFLR